MTTNEAAERLRRQLAIRDNDVADSPGQALLDRALAAERRATVERIREAIARTAAPGAHSAAVNGFRDVLADILDEEAAR